LAGDGEEYKEPFDRILLAQAITENMHFMASDEKSRNSNRTAS